LLPDLVDKPLWLLAQWLDVESKHFETARMFGHSAFLVAAVALTAWRLAIPQCVAIAYGITTHLVLDVVSDAGVGFGLGGWKSWLFWPFAIPRLRNLMAASPVHEFAWGFETRMYIASEVIGAALLAWDYVRKRAR
jgi:hypothetical protein